MAGCYQIVDRVVRGLSRGGFPCFGKGSNDFSFSLQQMAVYDACYPKLQDLLLSLRSVMKDKDSRITQEMIEDWVEDVADIDKVLRDRLFVLTVAAERGWRVASDLAFAMKGNHLAVRCKRLGSQSFFVIGDLADKLLAKCLKKDEKRKEDAKDTKVKEKKKKPAFKGGFRQQPYPYGWQQPPAQGYQPYPMQGAGGFYPQAATAQGPRPEFRQCLNCKQTGHLARGCPFKPPPAAALGVAPK